MMKYSHYMFVQSEHNLLIDQHKQGFQVNHRFQVSIVTSKAHGGEYGYVTMLKTKYCCCHITLEHTNLVCSTYLPILS